MAIAGIVYCTVLTYRYVKSGNTPILQPETVSPSSELVFISAAKEDYQYAGQLYDFMTSKDIPVFFSDRSLPKLGKSDYRHAIDEELEKAYHMAVVTSSRANVGKGWVEAEWGLFINERRSGYKKGNLVVFIVAPAQPRDLPPSLRSFEVIPLGMDGFGKALPYFRSSQETKKP